MLEARFAVRSPSERLPLLTPPTTRNGFQPAVRSPSNVVVLSTKKVMMPRFRFKLSKEGTYCYHPLRNIPGSTCPFVFILNTIPGILYGLNGKLVQRNCQMLKRMGFQLTIKHVPCPEPPHPENGLGNSGDAQDTGDHTTSCHTLPMKSDNLMFTPRRLQQGKVATISSRYLFRPSLGMVLAVQAAPLWNYNYT